MLTPEQKLSLESMIDSDDLPSVLNAISEICDGKAEHLVTNWQDPASARLWSRAGKVIDRCAASAAVANTVP